MKAFFIKTLSRIGYEYLKYVLSLEYAEVHQEMQNLQAHIELLISSLRYKQLLKDLKKDKE